jgi:DNA adenine methylase
MTKQEKNNVNSSAIFIFLNKTCFRGLFRMGPNGFNVPYGNYKNPEIVNKEHLEQIHKLIQNVIFECKDFNDSLDNVKTDDFVYLDPPYAPENKKSFVKYNSDGFDEETHLQLFKKTKELNAKFVMSNSDVPLVNDNFNDFNIEKIECRRAINSKKPESKTMEVIINNL